MRDRQKQEADLTKCSLGFLPRVEAWKLPCCSLPLAGRAQCPRTRPAPSLSSLPSAENRVREDAWPPQTEWQFSEEMWDGTVPPHLHLIASMFIVNGLLNYHKEHLVRLDSNAVFRTDNHVNAGQRLQLKFKSNIRMNKNCGSEHQKVWIEYFRNCRFFTHF